MNFDGTEKVIGRGAQADVLLYHGYAYKIYRPEYPAEWIEFEKKQQQAVNGAGLSPVKYYDTDDVHIVKMDLVEGETLEKRINEGAVELFTILAKAFSFVHEKDASGIDMPPLIYTAGMGLSDEDRAVVLPIVERLSSKMRNCVCHLDMHFLNIMVPPKETEKPMAEEKAGTDESKDASENAGDLGFTIIDWMNARIAPAVFDYARTYVIFDEYSQEGLAAYKEFILPQMWASGVSEKDFNDAVKACAIMRKREKS